MAPVLEEWRARFLARHDRPPASANYRGQVNALRAFYAYLERGSLLRDEEGRPLPDPTRRLACPPASRATNDWLRPAEDAALRTCPGTLQERILIALLAGAASGSARRSRSRSESSSWPPGRRR